MEGPDVARRRVVRWFILIVEKDILPFFRRINWFTLWSQVKDRVTQFLSKRANPFQRLLDFGRDSPILSFVLIGGSLIVVGVGISLIVVKNRNIPPLQ